MGNANGRIYAPVNTDDVSSVMGVNSHDVGYLCSNIHLQTNPFAKFKPVIYNNPDSVDGFWRANDGNCGLTPYHLSKIADVVNYCNGTMNGWIYAPPKVGNYYRITDFDGYNHNAVKPLQNGLIVPDKVFDGDKLTIGFPWMKGADSIGFDDIAVVNDTYWCFYMVREGSGTVIHGTTDAKSSSAQGGIVEINTSSIPQRIGTWKLYPCLSTASYKFTDAYPVSDYYTIPFVNPVTIVIESAANKVQITVDTTGVVGSMASFKITVKNNTSSAITFNNNSWQLRKAGVSESEGLTVTEKTGTLNNFSLAAGASTEITLNRITADCVQTGADIIILLQSGAYKYRGPVVQLTPAVPVS